MTYMNNTDNLNKQDDSRGKLVPFVISRAGGGMIDFGLTLVVTVILFTLVFVLTPSDKGFRKAITDTRSYYQASGLYDESIRAFEYDEETYDKAITVFYQNNERAVKDGLIKEYLSAKEDLKNKDAEGIKAFYSEEYQKALDYLDHDPVIIELMTRGMSTLILIGFTAFTLAVIVFYLIIPLKSFRHQTLGQKINRIKPVDFNTLQGIDKKAVLLRFASYAVLYFYIPYLLFYVIGDLTVGLIAILIVFNITFKYQRGLHDLISMTMMADITKETGR